MKLEETKLMTLLIEAFKAGEDYGITYGGWFDPTPTETKLKAEESCKEIINNYKKNEIRKTSKNVD